MKHSEEEKAMWLEDWRQSGSPKKDPDLPNMA